MIRHRVLSSQAPKKIRSRAKKLILIWLSEFQTLKIVVVYCGPTEWRFERRRGSSVDRKNTIRHLIQMMAITEEDLKEADEAEENSGSEEVKKYSNFHLDN